MKRILLILFLVGLSVSSYGAEVRATFYPPTLNDQVASQEYLLTLKHPLNGAFGLGQFKADSLGLGDVGSRLYRVTTGTVGLATDVYIVGKTGIGTSTPQTSLHNEGFSMFGESAPKLKCISYTGTTPSSTSSETLVISSINRAKIVGYSYLVRYNADSGMDSSYGPAMADAARLYSCIYDSTGFRMILSSGASALTSKEFTILVWYTE